MPGTSKISKTKRITKAKSSQKELSTAELDSVAGGGAIFEIRRLLNSKRPSPEDRVDEYFQNGPKPK